ncbi:hypothetical protein F0U59_37160 [Archangium gephyra]|nr:hypothetical protein F0U59_37160 [Archangium gephyra]
MAPTSRHAATLQAGAGSGLLVPGVASSGRAWESRAPSFRHMPGTSARSGAGVWGWGASSLAGGGARRSERVHTASATLSMGSTAARSSSVRGLSCRHGASTAMRASTGTATRTSASGSARGTRKDVGLRWPASWNANTSVATTKATAWGSASSRTASRGNQVNWTWGTPGVVLWGSAVSAWSQPSGPPCMEALETSTRRVMSTSARVTRTALPTGRAARRQRELGPEPTTSAARAQANTGVPSNSTQTSR